MMNVIYTNSLPVSSDRSYLSALIGLFDTELRDRVNMELPSSSQIVRITSNREGWSLNPGKLEPVVYFVNRYEIQGSTERLTVYVKETRRIAQKRLQMTCEVISEEEYNAGKKSPKAG